MEEKVIGDEHVRELKSQGLASGQKPGVALGQTFAEALSEEGRGVVVGGLPMGRGLS